MSSGRAAGLLASGLFVARALFGCATASPGGTTNFVDATAADAGTTGDAGMPPEAGPDAAADAPRSVALRGTSGWQIYPGGSYHYGPSIVVDTDQSIHMWTCSPGTGGAWDFIRYHRSTDGGHTWSTDVVALQPTPGTMDAFSTCDPGAVKIGSFFYVGYTSTTNSAGTQNQLFMARATTPEGPYAKWDGTGWGGSPKPIVTYGGPSTAYGIGEPSLVLMGKKLFVYYTNNDPAGHTDLSTTDDATVDDWPNHLTDHGHVITREHANEDSTDIKYVDALQRFVGVATYDRFSSNASVAAYQSFDGVNFMPATWVGARIQIGAHNIGLSGNGSAHVDVQMPNFVSYAYQPVGNGWGNWPTFLDPVTFADTPWGSITAGEVSSIVGGSDWNWSGPRAWDGDPSTVFSSISHGATAVATEWAMVDLGQTASVRGVTLTPRTNGYGFSVDFVVQSSADASTWMDVPGQAHTAFPNPGSTPVVLPFGAPLAARYWRLYATRLGVDDGANHYLQLGEIAVTLAN